MHSYIMVMNVVLRGMTPLYQNKRTVVKKRLLNSGSFATIKAVL